VTAALARGARSAWHAGDRAAALARLESLRSTPYLRSWVAAELALAAADAGDPDAVRTLMAHAVDPAAAAVLWRAEADALIAVGDSVSAAGVFDSLRSQTVGARKAAAEIELGRLRVASGDSAGGRVLLLEAFPEASGTARNRAAATLLDLGGHDLAFTLTLAQVLDRAGDGARALRAYDRARSLAAQEGTEFPENSRLERARLMGTVATRQEDALEEFRAIRETTGSERVGARNLDQWARMRARQGRTAQVTTLRGWLLEEYPGSDEAAQVAWDLGTNAEAGGMLDRALGHYDFLARNVRTHEFAGQARMRSGQIHLRRKNLPGAAEVFEAYLADFPDGRRWQEAAYWAGRTRLELGDTAVARRHLELVLTEPVEYYAVMAADLLGVPFAVDLPHRSGPTEPGWLSEGLMRLDALTEAGLDAGATAEVERLVDRAGSERGPRLRLADALIARGRTIDGINLGWALLRDEGSWDQQIVRVAYPFPYRELVRREAKEWGVDPFMMAAIIRQESAFKADIVSHAGAIGLMQVMPPTGAQLARTHGPDGFTRQSLTRPEVNLHLGAAFFVDMSRRYNDDVPLVLSAYNAGPTRATRWRQYPEASDPLRFTERIPFTETRGYVKNVRRNLGLYRVLYGQD
jgi:soluble lytic murein transglycosylase